MESLSTYYPNDENPTDPDELIWGKYTEEEWEAMTCAERAEAIYESGFGGQGARMELHECYGETTAASGRKYWIYFGWAPLPDGKPTKTTAKFAYYDTPMGREKYRL